jgi:CBS domain containing-hemolysin-like protein
MRRERVQLAIVADRPDRPLGIVSMKDLVEPLVGDLVAW